MPLPKKKNKWGCDSMKTELIIYDITLYNPKNKMSLIRSGSSDIYNTEGIISQVKNEIKQHDKLLLWLNVVIVIGDKRVKLTHISGGISITSAEKFNDVLEKLKEMGERLIDMGESHKIFSNKDF